MDNVSVIEQGIADRRAGRTKNPYSTLWVSPYSAAWIYRNRKSWDKGWQAEDKRQALMQRKTNER